MNAEQADRDRKAKDIFERATELSTVEARVACLDEACGDDELLRQRVHELLASHQQDSFLQQPAARLQVKTVLVPITEQTGDVIGRYKLREKIGEGGCGVVYVADQEEPIRRRVALKVIKLGMDTRAVIARFDAERQALAMMEHPNIARVLDAGTTGSGRPYFVMELVRGIKITDYCDQAKLSTRDRLDLFIKVCQAVQHAHHKGIIHRDLKPSNVLVTLHDGVPVPKIIDFGIAKAIPQLRDRLTDATVYTELHQLLGTPAYMSPEQAEMSGLDIDTRSDIYSLGVLLYELLTGQTPFTAEQLLCSGVDEMRRIIRDVEPQRPSTRLSTLGLADATELSQKRQAKIPALATSVQGDLDWIVMKALEKDRTRRYSTSLEFAADVQRHLNSEAVLARPPSLVYRLQRTVRRNKVVFAAAAAVLIALLTGLFVAFWQATEANRARDGERSARLEAEGQSRMAAASESRFRDLHYAAAINLAGQAWEQNGMARLQELLDETSGYGRRGFEWYYFQRLLHTELLAVDPHGQVLTVAVSPDGSMFATGDAAARVKLWNLVTGQELRTCVGHPEFLDPRKDGSRTKNIILSISFSPDSRRLVTSGMDRIPKVWEANTGRELLALTGHRGAVKSAAFSPDGQSIATGSSDRTLRLWNAENGQELAIFNSKGPVESLAFSPDGRSIAAAGARDSTVAWEIRQGNELVEFKGHGHPANCIAFFPDGRRIAMGIGNVAKILDLDDGTELILKNHGGHVYAVAVSSDGRRVLAVDGDGLASVYNAATGERTQTIKGHRSGIHTGVFLPDGHRILTGSWDGTARIWDATANHEFLELKGHRGSVTSLGFSSDDQRIVSGGDDGTARVWDLATGTQLLGLMGHEGTVSSVAFSPDARLVATAGKDQQLIVWDGHRGNRQFTVRARSSIPAAAFSHDGARIAFADENRFRMVETANGKESLASSSAPAGIAAICFSPDDKNVVSLGFDRRLRFWDAVTGAELSAISGLNIYYSLDVSPDGSKAITGGVDDVARIWDVRTGRELISLRGHTADILGVAFSPDGGRAVTVGEDGTLRTWDPVNGRSLLTIQSHKASIPALAVSPNGLRFATADIEGAIRIWRAASAAEVANWTPR